MKKLILKAVLLVAGGVSGMSEAEVAALLAPGPVKQNSFTRCEVNFTPGEKYATAKRQWQGCPTILRTPKGILYAGWYSGGPGEGLLNYSLMVKSTDGGISWSREPLLVIDSLPEKKIQSLDIQFWLDPQNRFWFFWTQRDYNYPMKDPRHLSVWAMVCDDPDAETLKFGEPRFITPGFLRCQPTVLADGRWLLPAYDWVDDHYRYSESFDNGNSWHRRIAGKKHPRWAFDETMFLEQRDGTLRLLARCGKGVGKMIECISTDGGKSWSDGKLSNIPNPASRFFIKRLRSGNILLVNNFQSDDRFSLSAAISNDDGKTWDHRLLLDPRRCTYPDVVENPDGSFYIIYDFSRGNFKEILLARLTEQDIVWGLKKNALQNESSFLSQIVNKAPHPAQLSAEERALSDRYRPKNKKNRIVVAVELDGRKGQCTLKDVQAEKFKVSGKAKKFSWQLTGRPRLTEKFQEYTFSFIPSSSRITLGLTMGSSGAADIDAVTIENGTIVNGSFENLNSRQETAAWRYYSPDSGQIGKSDAADGRNYMRVSRELPARQTIKVTPGEKVTITFQARQAPEALVKPLFPWHSQPTDK